MALYIIIMKAEWSSIKLIQASAGIKLDDYIG